MKQITWPAAAVAIVLAGVAGDHAQAAAGSADGASRPTAAAQQARFDDALRLYRSGRWSAAYGRFAHLADQGHPDAARIALNMHRFGLTLYRTAWSATPPQLQDWQTAARGGAGLGPLVSGD